MERLQKIISNSGYCSRRKAEQLIEAGKVFVNGEKITTLGYKASISDDIVVNGEQILKKEDKVYFLLNKPRSIITSAIDDKQRKTVVDLINCEKRIYPIGRLDYDTTGLIILTNDGELTNLLNHPSSNVEKLYIAKLSGIPTKIELQKLQRGVIIDGKKTSRCKTKLKKLDKKSDTSVVEIIIHEGRNHQVKKMFEAIGYKVLKLKREKYSFLDIKNLKSGQYRELTIHEVKKLYNESKKNTRN